MSRYNKGSARLLTRLRRGRSEALRPPPILTLSQWANQFAYLSKGSNASTGKFKSFRYQDGMMDAVTDPSVHTITVMKSARVGYTKMLDHMVGYFIHQDPAPLLVVQPREVDARDYSDTEIANMLRDTPVLAAIAGDLNSRASKQKINKRVFRNGASVTFVGANSPDGFRRINARIVAFDEVDAYPPQGAGDDGDQIDLGAKRTETFWNSKILLGSTPLVKGNSRIEKSWEESDQRRYYVPCPHCKHKQTLKWENFKWDKAEDGTHLPKTAYFRCEAEGCGKRIEESSKKTMIDQGEWIASKPSHGHAGFHVWTAYSLFPKARWGMIAAAWLEVYKDPLRKKSFVNLTLGLPHQEVVNIADPDVLKARVEPYNWETLPSDVQFVTVGADTHPGRLEVTFVGWGKDEEAWVARHEVLNGDASHLQVWKDLDDLLATPCETDDGRKLFVQAVCIDSAGHNSDMVYKFARERKRRRIYAIIGRGNLNSASPRMIWPKTASRTKNSGDKPYTVGVDTAKDEVSTRLAIVPDELVPTPRAVHFPAVGLSADYFDQLTSEHAITRNVGGRISRKWEKKSVGARNEAWDCLVYALAARMSLPKKLSTAPRKPRPLVSANDNEPTAEPVHKEERPKRRQRERWGAYR